MNTLEHALGSVASASRFFVYLLAWNESRGKFDKKPIGSPANAGLTYAQAYTEAMRLRSTGQQATVGLWITADSGLFFLDIDALPAEYTADTRAQNLLAALPGAFVEWSVGRRGLHVLGRMTTPVLHSSRDDAQHLEFYTSERGCALNIDATPTGSIDTSHDVSGIVSQFFPPRSTVAATGERRTEWRGPADDDELVRRMLAARVSAESAFGGKASISQLWSGEVERNSNNDAALALHLAFWTGCDPERMAQLMLRSGMVRQKWRDHRTYLSTTIANACASCTSVYQERPSLPLPLPKPGATPAVKNAADLQRRTFNPIQWALQDLLPEGVTILSSDPKLGKSWMVYGWCIAIATGNPIWEGRAPEKKGDALLLALEDNDRRMRRRLDKLLPTFGSPSIGRLFYACDWPRGAEGVAAIREFLVAHPETRIVVIDTIAAFRNADPGRKNAYTWDYEVGALLKPLSQEFQCAFVLVSHNRKAGSGDTHVNQEVSGTTGLVGGVDNVFVLKRSSGNVTAVLHTDGRDIENQLELALQLHDGRWGYVGDAKDVNRSQQRNSVLEALARVGGVGTARDIHEAMGATEKLGTLRVRLTRMVGAGDLDLSGRLYSRVHPDTRFAQVVTPPPLPGVTTPRVTPG